MFGELVSLKLFRWSRNTDWIVAFVVMMVVDWCAVVCGDDSVVKCSSFVRTGDFSPTDLNALNFVALKCSVAFCFDVFVVSTGWPFDLMFGWILASDLSRLKLSACWLPSPLSAAKFNSFDASDEWFAIATFCVDVFGDAVESESWRTLSDEFTVVFVDDVVVGWLVVCVAFRCTSDVSFFTVPSPNGLWLSEMFNGIASVDDAMGIKWFSLSMAFRLSNCVRFAENSWLMVLVVVVLGPPTIATGFAVHIMNEMARRSEHTMATRALLQSNSSWIGINLRNAVRQLSHHYTQHRPLYSYWFCDRIQRKSHTSYIWIHQAAAIWSKCVLSSVHLSNLHIKFAKLRHIHRGVVRATEQKFQVQNSTWQSVFFSASLALSWFAVCGYFFVISVDQIWFIQISFVIFSPKFTLIALYLLVNHTRVKYFSICKC